MIRGVDDVASGERPAIAPAVAAGGAEPRAELADAAAAAAAFRSIITSGVDRDRNMIALGEEGGIRPEVILPAVTREHVAHLRMADAKDMAAR